MFKMNNCHFPRAPRAVWLSAVLLWSGYFPHPPHLETDFSPTSKHVSLVSAMNSSEKEMSPKCKKALQAITGKAAVCWGLGEPLRIEEIQVDPPGPSEVRVKILRASLCHTDILFWNGFPAPLFPKVLGHEGVGLVESVGENVRELKEGDMVIPIYIGGCNECEDCKSGKTNLCPNHPVNFDGLMPDGTSRLSCRGQKLYQLFCCSTWTEYAVVHQDYVMKIDSSLPLQHSSIISCGYSTGFGGIWKETKVCQGSTVAVFGLGGVGLGAVEAARLRGAAKIIAVDLNELKRDKGKVFGTTDFINPREIEKSVSEAILEITGGVGVDYSIECTGVPSLLSQAIDCTRQGRGVTIAIGVSTELMANVNVLSLVLGRTLKGSSFGGIRPRSDLPLIISKCLNKELHLDEMVTHELRLDDINRALELAKQPDCLKIIIHVSE